MTTNVREHRWLSWGATATGPGHRRMGLPNQDAWAVRHYNSGVVVAVSDGLGSCTHADVGSLAACRAVAEATKLHFRYSPADMTGMPALVQHLWKMMLLGHSPSESSATCLFVAMRYGANALLAQLGDGLVAACRRDGGIDLLMPDKADSFANLTVGLGSSQAAAGWRTLSVHEERYRAFVLCTDGVSDDLVPDAVGEFAWGVFEHYRRHSGRERSRDLHRWLNAWPVPGHSDDKTIACIFRSEDAHA